MKGSWHSGQAAGTASPGTSTDTVCSRRKAQGSWPAGSALQLHVLLIKEKCLQGRIRYLLSGAETRG